MPSFLEPGNFSLSAVLLLGTAVFAATGVLASARRNMDWVGAVVLAVVTATGGGTLRDLLTGQLPVFWVREPVYIWIAVGTALVMLPLLQVIRFPERALLWADAAGLALFTWVGCAKTQELGLHPSVVVLMGVLTGSGGGLIRDVLSAQVPTILRQSELYAAATLPGALIFVVLQQFPVAPGLVAAACIGSVLLVRLAAIRWRLMLPTLRDL
jgi:uncharacterized membrane protein YeiH